VTSDRGVRLSVPSADAMRELGARIGSACVGGDVLILAGDLGAGKTTLTQGIARGMGIADAITSPTYVIARIHPNPAEGPDLVHVDAYRLRSIDELDDLDIDADLERSVVVVEWGSGMADGLSTSRIDISIERPDDAQDETRLVTARGGASRFDAALRAETWTSP
jgi:tRNA threonylcarbamoyladenosine biosynthesis protein TsaE